jgi:hypothetical protein
MIHEELDGQYDLETREQTQSGRMSGRIIDILHSSRLCMPHLKSMLLQYYCHMINIDISKSFQHIIYPVFVPLREELANGTLAPMSNVTEPPYLVVKCLVLSFDLT